MASLEAQPSRTPELLGRPGDAVTAGITTAVIMVVAAVSPQHAWQQPILRLVDTGVGVGVGVVATWTGIQLKRFLPARSVLPAQAKVKIDLSERAVVRLPHIRFGRAPLLVRLPLLILFCQWLLGLAEPRGLPEVPVVSCPRRG
jgi:hypothetical protein